jgi:site-specific DNA-methyltransferase (adenine-specific)
MIEDNIIYCAECVSFMEGLPGEHIDLTVTSPPYDSLRTYNGYSFDFERVAMELYRVTKGGGVVVWVVGDATVRGSESGTSFRQALFFKDVGFNLHDTMIWTKSGGGAIGSNLCYTQNFEYMFVLSKGRPKAVNIIYDIPNASFGKAPRITGRRTKDGVLKREVRKPVKEFSRRNNWWYVPPRGYGEHPAVFPEALARDHILSWSNEGDIVFDPFVGSGTTAVAALKAGRRYLGCDVSEAYVEMATARVEGSRTGQPLPNITI